MSVRRGTVVLLVGASLIAGCGSEGDNADSGDADKPETAQEAKPKPKAADPLACLETAGLENPEKRASDLWRGFNPSGGAVRVSRLPSPKEAASAVGEATDVRAAKAGRYAVFGGFKASDDGTAVRSVAACLGR